MSESRVFFSIIVVSLNAGKTIRETIESILTQTYQNFEIIVKDGLSKDDTLKQIPEDERIRVYSQKDTGIYEGMNQAIEYVRGEYVSFMNCGDRFHDATVLQRVYETAQKIGDKEHRIIYGDYFSARIVSSQPKALSKAYLFRRPLCHQSMLFSRNIFTDIGVYDCDMRIAADYELTVHAFVKGVHFEHCGCVVCDYEGGGASAQKKNQQRKHQELATAQTRYFAKGELLKMKAKYMMTMPGLRRFLASEDRPEWVRKLYHKVVNPINE